MNFDHTELAKCLHKDKLCYDYLEPTSSNRYGWKYYFLPGEKKISIGVNEEMKQLKASANFPYFWRGHNFKSSRNEMIEAINYSSEALNCNLMEAEIKQFEFGSIVEVEKSVEEILSNHTKAIGRNRQPYYKKNLLTGIYFEDNSSTLKLYNAGLNIKNKLTEVTRKHLTNNFRYDPTKNYAKVEMRYKKPENYFKQRSITLTQLLNQDFMKKCKEDLIHQYSMIEKTTHCKLPEKKKDINSATLPTYLLLKLGEQYGFNALQLIKEEIKTIPTEILSLNDKKARRSQIKRNIEKLKGEGESPYDLKSLLDAKEID